MRSTPINLYSPSSSPTGASTIPPYLLLRLHLITSTPYLTILSAAQNKKPKKQLQEPVQAVIDMTKWKEDEIDKFKRGGTWLFECGRVPLSSSKGANQQPPYNNPGLTSTLLNTPSKSKSKDVLPPRNSNIQRTQSYKIALCTIDVSNAVPINPHEVLTPEDILQGTSSNAAYLCDPKQELSVNRHRYVVRDCYQWDSIVEFTIDQKPIVLQKPNMCSNCLKKVAELFCREDSQAYCSECFTQQHTSTNRRLHTKEPVSHYNCPLPCGKHPSMAADSFCVDCNRSVCSTCRNEICDRSTPVHYYASLMSLNRQLGDKVAQQGYNFKKMLLERLSVCESTITKLNNRYYEQLAVLANKYSKEKAVLTARFQGQISSYARRHLELRRQMDQYLWADNYLKFIEIDSEGEVAIRQKLAWTQEGWKQMIP